MLHPARSLEQRSVTSFILRAMWDVIPHQACTMDAPLVDADDPIAGLLQEADDLVPAVWIIPVLALCCALNRNADVRLGDRSAVVCQRDAGRHLGRIYAENVAGCPMQPDVTEVGRLKN